ncbi:transmembrane protein 252 isoform X1 [Ursus americanus]|uniref:transmembrane protein 252 isoform X1 n=1 Tax=Ursus americanus TaxID=9643 RepID=UPI000E6DB280|nr:transmembrane protein 252 isoform X1 [Ursus americanus]
MQNRTSLVLCALALLMGFLMICLGAFFISSGSIFNCRGNLILAYMLLPLGFVILLSGIFWSTYRQARESKGVFTHVLRRHLSHGAPLATVDRCPAYTEWPGSESRKSCISQKHMHSKWEPTLRPDFYPPAYEESLDAEKQPCPAGGEALGVPPPLYTEIGLEFEDAMDARPEAPPSYEESVAGRAPAATSLQDAERQSRGC